MEFTAKLNYVRVSPQKARLVLDLIKGRRVEEALDTLTVCQEGYRAQAVQTSALGGGERQLRQRGKGPGHRCRPPVREARGRQRRAAHEAYPSRAHGPRLPLSAAHLARGDCAGGEGGRQRSCRTWRRRWKKAHRPRSRPGKSGRKHRQEEGGGEEAGG